MNHSMQTIAIAATFSAELIEDPLVFWMRELELEARIEFAPFNQVFRLLMDPASLLSTNHHGVNTLLIRLEDWAAFEDLPRAALDRDVQGRICKAIEQNVEDFIHALQSAAASSGVPFLVCFCPASDTLRSNRPLADFVEKMESHALARLQGSAHLVGSEELSRMYPVSAEYDQLSDELARIPYTPLFFCALGTMIMRRLHALQSAPRKVIVLDCDQTLWIGNCAEEGVEGVRVDPPRRALQEFMVAEQRAGRLLCLCSRNNETDVLEVLRRHPDMALRPEHLAAWRINWQPKSQNLQSLAQELGLDLDSFIFVDDDPFECAEVQAAFPQVLSLPLPGRSSEFGRFLANVWAFDRVRQPTLEDRNRTDFHRQDRERKRYQQQMTTLADFLAGLQLRVRFENAAPPHHGRISQLTQRTNQFNFTTRRRSELDVQQFFLSANGEGLVIEVSDRFGDYGLVGVLTFTATVNAIEVDTFLLSCRTLGRGVEHRMLARLGGLAQERGLEWVDVHYAPTPKNQAARDFLDSIGEASQRSKGPGFLYRFSAAAAAAVHYSPAANVPPRPKEPRDETSRADDSPDAPSKETRIDLQWAGAKPVTIARIASELTSAEAVLAKLDKQETQARPKIDTAFVTPVNSLEAHLASIWTELLGCSPIGLNDNFFELGGHSILIIRMISRLRDDFGVQLPMRSFFDAPTIAGLAAAVTKIRDELVDTTVAAELLEQIAQMPESEVEALLARKKLASTRGLPSTARPDAIRDASRQPVNTVSTVIAAPVTSLGTYGCADIVHFPLRPGSELVYSRSTQVREVLPAAVLQSLLQCRGFKGLEEHAQEICRRLPSSSNLPEVRSQLAKSVKAGFLVPQPDVVKASASRNPPGPGGVEIKTVAFPTSNRVAALRRGLLSYLDNSREHGRSVDFVVMDDSRSKESCFACQQMLLEVQPRADVRLLYAGMDERKQFAKRLIAAGDLPAEIVQFALLGWENGAYSAGACRNALLLQTAGEAFFSADDDTICEIRRAPEERGGLRLTNESSPEEFWFYPDLEAARKSLTVQSQDVLALHEQYLGQNLPTLAANAKATGAIDLSQADPCLGRHLKEGTGKVLITLNGLAGDCGWNAPFGCWGRPMGFLLMDGESRERLLPSEAHYRSACLSRQQLRVVNRPTIDRDSLCLTTFVGLDNRDLLPPFMPVLRGEDVVFGVLLRQCFEDEFMAHLPSALVHAPTEARAFSPGEIFRSSSGYDMARLLIDCAQSFQAAPGRIEAPGRMAALGEYLAEVGSLPLVDFRALVRRQALTSSALFLQAMEDALRSKQETPAFWAADVRKYMDLLRDYLGSDLFAVPLDLAASTRSTDEAMTAAQQFIFKFGQLLLWWPAIIETAKTLRQDGFRLARVIKA